MAERSLLVLRDMKAAHRGPTCEKDCNLQCVMMTEI